MYAGAGTSIHNRASAIGLRKYSTFINHEFSLVVVVIIDRDYHRCILHAFDNDSL